MHKSEELQITTHIYTYDIIWSSSYDIYIYIYM